MTQPTTVPAQPFGPPWTAAVDAFLSARRLAPATVRSYRTTLDALGTAIGSQRPVDDLDARDLADALVTLYDDAAPATWNRVRSTVDAFLVWLVRQEWTPQRTHERYAALVERRRVPDGPPRAVEWPRLERLFTHPGIPLRERLLWRMLYETAARAQEVLRLDVEDLDLPERRALTTRKGGHHDALVWGTATATLLPRYLRGRTTGPVFLSTQPPAPMRPAARHDTDPASGLRRLSYRRAAEVFTDHSGGLTLHQLRHSAIVDLLEAGYATPLVRAKSGHRSLRSFEVYAKPTPRAVAAMTDDLEHRRRG